LPVATTATSVGVAISRLPPPSALRRPTAPRYQRVSIPPVASCSNRRTAECISPPRSRQSRLRFFRIRHTIRRPAGEAAVVRLARNKSSSSANQKQRAAVTRTSCRQVYVERTKSLAAGDRRQRLQDFSCCQHSYCSLSRGLYASVFCNRSHFQPVSTDEEPLQFTGNGISFTYQYVYF